MEAEVWKLYWESLKQKDGLQTEKGAGHFNGRIRGNYVGGKTRMSGDKKGDKKGQAQRLTGGLFFINFSD
jgi:hypothetical protein